MKISVFAGVTALALLPAVARAQAPPEPAPPPLTLTQALQRALEANPAVLRAEAEVEVSRRQKDAILATVLPKVNVQGNFTRNSKEGAFGSGDERQVILPESDWNYRLAFSQPIYAGRREQRALQQARLGIDSSRWATLTARERLIVAVVSDYLSVLEAEALLEVERKNLTLAENRRKQAEDLYTAGETTKVESLRAVTDIKAAERRVAAARQQREAAVGRLRLSLVLDGPISVGPLEKIFPPLPPEAELQRQAESERPEVAQAATALEIAKLEVLKQRGAWQPVVTADGGYLKQRSSFPSDQYGFVALHLNVPIFQGGEVKAKVAIAKERQKQAELQLDELRRQVREQVHQATTDLATAETNLTLAREQLAASEAEYAQASDLFQAQETTALDLEAAESGLAEARRAVATAEIDRNLAELTIWSAAGQLQETLLPQGETSR